MRTMTGALITATLFTLAATPAMGQVEAWQNRWYWGGQGGLFRYQTRTQAYREATTFGGHWFITARRSALYLAFDHIKFRSGTTSQVADATGVTPVQFSSGRRIQATVYAVPTDRSPQFFLGGGFVIHQITDAVPTGTLSAVQQATVLRTLDRETTKAYAVLGAGFQIRLGGLVLFGQYQYMPGSDEFLLAGESHAFTGGLRISITGSHEVVTTER